MTLQYKMENSPNKSIIYGNVFQNKYGKFLPICSSINDRTNVNSILDYIKESVHFKKYNRISYAYRVQEVPIVFITEKKNIESQYYEDAYSDETIQGSGEKLLHLLQKFNVKNVFICCLIQQFNPLMPFQTTNYRAIVENSRLLLDQLYKKVVNLQDKYEDNKSLKDLLLKDNKTVKLKKCNLNDGLGELIGSQSKKENVVERPNHIYKKGKPKFLTRPTVSTDTTAYQIKCMWERCKTMRTQFSEIKGSLEDKEIEQLRYFVMYDKNPLINSVIRLFLLFENISKELLTQDYQFEKIRQMDFDVLSKERLQKCDEMMKSHRKLNVDSIMKVNRAMGLLFSMMELKIRFSKTFNRIAEMMKKSEQGKQDIQDAIAGQSKANSSQQNQIEIKMNPRKPSVQNIQKNTKLAA